MKLIKQLKFTSLIIITYFFLLTNAQQLFAADATISTATTSLVTLADNDDLIVTTPGSITMSTETAVQNSGNNTTLNNSGTITSSLSGASSTIFLDAGKTMLSLTNSGTISSSASNNTFGAIHLAHRTSILTTLTNTGTITSNEDAIFVNGTITTLTNSLTISGGTTPGTTDSGNGIVISISGLISNLTNSGTITGNDRDGIDQLGTITLLTNSGTIRAIVFDGINNDNGLTAGQATISTINNSGTIRGNRHGIGQDDGLITTLTNTGSIIGDTEAGVYSGASGNIITINNDSGTISGALYGIRNNGGSLTTINNSGTISGGTNSILNTGTLGTINLNKGSVLIGTISSTGSYTLNMNVGASKSYFVSTEGAGTITLNDLDNRPVVKGSALAINIGSMEISGENLYQKTSNITDAIDRNVKNNKDTWVEPYYSESTRDSGGDSSQIRQFKNNKQGINAGFKTENSATPLQVIFNVDQTKNNIDSSEHIINSDGVMIGLVAPSYAKYEGFDVSVKGLVGYANSKTDRKILDNTSSTGERTLTGEYDSYYAVVGSALSKNYNLDKDLNANLTLGVDLTSEFRDSYSENLYFKYNSLELIQFQPRIQSEFIKTTGKDSNVFFTAGVGAREVLSGKTQKYSMNNTGVSFTTPNSGDYYASLAAGTNMNVAANVNFYALVSAKMSDRDTETYQASIGLKGTF
jgi:hypothetical protein